MYPLKMVIFHSYVSLPEGNTTQNRPTHIFWQMFHGEYDDSPVKLGLWPFFRREEAGWV